MCGSVSAHCVDSSAARPLDWAQAAWERFISDCLSCQLTLPPALLLHPLVASKNWAAPWTGRNSHLGPHVLKSEWRVHPLD